MEDFVAQAMALSAIAKAGKAGDAYTKAQTDALLDGKADLVDGKIPAAELPSYVDDVVEYASTAAFPATGESGKIYIATDTNKTYRWGGSSYAEISESLALGETASTAYAGNKGKANADAIAAIKDGTNIDSFADVETALANVPKLTLIGSINSLSMDMAFEQILTTSEAILSNQLYIVNLEVASSTLSSTVTMTIPIATLFSSKSQFEVRINDTHICDLRIRLSGSNNSSVRVTNRNTSVTATIYLALYKVG